MSDTSFDMTRIFGSSLAGRQNQMIAAIILIVVIATSLALGIFSTVKVLDKNVELDTLRVKQEVRVGEDSILIDGTTNRISAVKKNDDGTKEADNVVILPKANVDADTGKAVEGTTEANILAVANVTKNMLDIGTTFEEVDGKIKVKTDAVGFQPGTQLDMANTKVVNLATPANPGDATNKSYVDNQMSILDIKQSCRVATTGNLNFTYANGTAGVGATLTNNDGDAVVNIDGVALQLNDRVLIKNQGNDSHNGIYVVTIEGTATATAVLTRAVDFNHSSKVSGGAFTFVEEGGQADKGFVVTSNGQINVDTDNIAFSQFSAVANVLTQADLGTAGNKVLQAVATGVNNGQFLKVNGDRIESQALGTAASKNVGVQQNNILVVSNTAGAAFPVDNDFLQVSGTSIIGRSNTELKSDLSLGGAADLNIGIGANNLLKVRSDGTVADADFIRVFGINGEVEGRSATELKSDLNLGGAADLDLGIAAGNIIGVSASATGGDAIEDNDFLRVSGTSVVGLSSDDVATALVADIKPKLFMSEEIILDSGGTPQTTGFQTGDPSKIFTRTIEQPANTTLLDVGLTFNTRCAAATVGNSMQLAFKAGTATGGEQIAVERSLANPGTTIPAGTVVSVENQICMTAEADFKFADGSSLPTERFVGTDAARNIIITLTRTGAVSPATDPGSVIPFIKVRRYPFVGA